MIKLQFVAERKLGSALIRWFGGGQVSHVDWVTPSGALLGARWDCVGGRPRGVWPRPPDYLRFTRRIVMGIPVTEEQAKAHHDFLYYQRGTPYDWRAIVGFAIDRDWRKPDAWMCSELQAAALEVAGIVRPLYLACNKITPGMLALMVSALPGAAVIEENLA